MIITAHNDQVIALYPWLMTVSPTQLKFTASGTLSAWVVIMCQSSA